MRKPFFVLKYKLEMQSKSRWIKVSATFTFIRRFYSKRLTFCVSMCFLGIEPTTFCAANTMLHHWATGTLLNAKRESERSQSWFLKHCSSVFQGVKEHKCRICGREFTLLANMKRHVLIHTNIRAYRCHLCYKSFVQKQTLKAHMIVHSDIKPYKCKVRRRLIHPGFLQVWWRPVWDRVME